MPLHRDIHWIGRQWAVTGHGMQLIDQKLQGFFDIEVSRLWDDVLIESVHAKEWLNTADFDKGLALARARHPQPPGAATPPPLSPVAKSIEPKPGPAKLETPKPVAPAPTKPAPVEPPRAAAALQAPAIATRPPVEPPTTVAPPRQAAPPPAIEPPAPLPPIVKPAEPKRGTLKLGAPEPVTVTLIKRRPAEASATVTPPPQAAPPPAVEPAVEPRRAAAEPLATVIATPAPSVEPPSSLSLFQMRYEGRARFVRPWRVVARKI
jgi:hypothetical protein